MGIECIMFVIFHKVITRIETITVNPRFKKDLKFQIHLSIHIRHFFSGFWETKIWLTYAYLLHSVRRMNEMSQQDIYPCDRLCRAE